MTRQTGFVSRNGVLLVACLSSFITPFMSSSVTVALPTMGKELSMGAVALGWVNMSFLLSTGTFLLPFGRLGDLWGRRMIFLFGAAVLTIASVWVALAGSVATLLVGRVLQGFGSAMLFSTAMPILVAATPPEQRGKALGIAVAVTYVGLSVGPFLGGLITQHLGWRYLFWLNLPFGVLLLAATLLLVRADRPDSSGQTYDYLGAVILVVGLFAAMYGFSVLPTLPAWLLIATGAVLLTVFVLYEDRQTSPLVAIDLFRRSTVFSFSLLAALINYAATFAVSFLLSLYLQKVKGLSPQDAGFILVCQPFMQAVFSPIAGKLSDRLQPRTLASAGMALTFVGLVPLIFLTDKTPLWYLVGSLGILGLGFGLFSSPNMNAIMSAVDRRALGIAGAMVSTVRQIGMLVSMGVVIMAMTHFVGKQELKPENFQAFLASIRIVFGLFAVLSIGGIFASLARGHIER